MAYISQDDKKKIAPAIKALLKKHGLKGSLSIHNHMTLTLTVTQGSIDFIANYNQTCADRYPRHRNLADTNLEINQYWFHEQFSGKALSFLTEAYKALKGAGWYDRSDIMTDYFDIAYYIDIKIGKWNKPYALVK